MIEYIYECQKCEKVFSFHQSIKDDALTDCEFCGGNDCLIRLIQPPLYVKVINAPTTLGQLAEQNSKTMSKEELDKLAAHHQTKKTINRIPEDQRPATRDTETDVKVPEWVEKPRTKDTKDVMKMTPTQKQRYVMTGE